MDIDLTKKANNKNKGRDFSEDSNGAENKSVEDGGSETTRTVTPHKLNSWAERLREDFIPEEA